MAGFPFAPRKLVAIGNLAPFMRRIDTVIDQVFGQSPISDLKDPRVCRLLPLWLNLLDKRNCRATFICITRHLMEVMRSLKTRNKFSSWKGYLLWLKHILDAEQGSRGGPRWQNYLSPLTGLKIVSYHLDKIEIELFLDSPAFKTTPPKVLVFQTVERRLINLGQQIGLESDCQRRPDPDFTGDPLTVQRLHHPMISYERIASFGLFYPNVNAAVHYLNRNVKKVFNEKSNRAFIMPLSRNTLFPNRKSDSFLIYRDDVLKLKMKKEKLESALQVDRFTK